MIDWGDYFVLRPLQETKYLSAIRREAQHALNALLSERDARYAKLEALLTNNGLGLGKDTDDLKAISVFFCENTPPDLPSKDENPLWHEFLTDFSIYFGDAIIEKVTETNVRWGVKNVALRGGTPRYRAVLIGFLSRQQYLDPQYFLEMLSYQKSVGEELDLNFLNSLVEYSRLL